MSKIINSALRGYSNRATVLGSYYFLVSQLITGSKYDFIPKDMFFNIGCQILCFIFDCGVKRKNCFLTDIASFLEELNLEIYKQAINEIDYMDLANYIVTKISGGRVPYYFDYYDNDEGVFDKTHIQLIIAEQKKVNGEVRLSYVLTEKGNKLLLATKEYDDMFKIRVSQILAAMRIEQGQYTQAQEDIIDIISVLEMQSQEIQRYLKNVKTNVFILRTERFVDMFSNTLDVVKQESEKYEQMDSDVKVLIVDAEITLSSSIENSIKSVDNLRKKIKDLNNLATSIRVAKESASNLVTVLQNFRSEYNDILRMLLRTSVGSRFNFKEEILNKVEKNPNYLMKLEEVYRGLFRPQLPNYFTVQVPYQEQELKSRKVAAAPKESVSFGDIVDNEDLNARIAESEKQYNIFVSELLKYGVNHEEFKLSDFINYLLSEDRMLYMQITADAKNLRNALMNLSDNIHGKNGGGLDIDELKEDLKRISYAPSLEFQLERVFSYIFNETDVAVNIRTIECRDTTEEITLNTEIDIEKMSCRKLTVPDLKFKLEFKF